VISEIELAGSVCRAIIAITGTNGKTTTTTLIGEGFARIGRTCAILGNIGVPFSQQVLALAPVTLSLESLVPVGDDEKFHPRVAVILNLTPDHFGPLQGPRRYLEAKKRIAMNQTRLNFLVLNTAIRCCGA